MPTGSPAPTSCAASATARSSRVVGDGALTGGMCWEALNNIAADPERAVVIVVNDNGRSYAPTIGGLADHLATLRTAPGYERTLGVVRDAMQRVPVIGEPVYDALHGAQARHQGSPCAAGDSSRTWASNTSGRSTGTTSPRWRPRCARAQRVRRAGHRAHGHPQGLRLRAGRGRRGRPHARQRRPSSPAPASG